MDSQSNFEELLGKKWNGPVESPCPLVILENQYFMDIEGDGKENHSNEI